MRFLRAAWPIASRRQRLAAVRAGLAGASTTLSTGRMYFEYFLPDTTVHLDSELDARIYELLPFADEADPVLGQTLRRRYPHLQNLPVLPRDSAPWRAAAVVTLPERDTPELVQRALERSIARFITTWAQTDPRRAAKIAFSPTDPAEQIRSEFKLGHSGEAQKLLWQAWKNPESREELEDICGQYAYGDPAWYAATDAIQNPVTRLTLLAKYARGALRSSPAYEEPS